MEISSIITALENFDGEYKRKEIDYAVAHQEEITPLLIDILRKVITDPQKYADNEDYFGHIYALVLLGYFKETAAHDLIIQMFSLSDELIDELYGDFAFENFGTALYQTSGGSMEKIKKFIADRSMSADIRTVAMRSLSFAVVDGIMSREELLKYLCGFFKGDEAEPTSGFWGFVAADICDLCPDENAYQVIKKAYEDELIDPLIVGFEEFQEAIDRGVEESLNRIRMEKEDFMPDYIHEMMSWWACFHDKEDDEQAELEYKFVSDVIQKKETVPKKKAKSKKQQKKKGN